MNKVFLVELCYFPLFHSHLSYSEGSVYKGGRVCGGFFQVNASYFEPVQVIQTFIMFQRLCLTLFCATSVVGVPNAVAKRQSGTSVVNLGNNTGTPQHLASGVLYGIPDTANQIPDHFYTDMGFNYARAGGAQIPAPGRGWIWGLTEYKVCQRITVSNSQYALTNGLLLLEPLCICIVQLQDHEEIQRQLHFPDS